MFEGTMAQKALSKMKMMVKIGIGISLLVNITVCPMYASTASTPVGFEYFNLSFLGMISAIVLSFGAVFGESLFRMITPQKHYITRAKANLLLNELFWTCACGIVPFAILVNVYF